MFRLIGSILRWVLGWIYFVCIICFAGAMLGVFTHTAYAVFFVSQADYGFYASLGFMNGLKYAGVWAGGASIVMCVVRARKEFLAGQALGEVKSGYE